jgi:AraC-like DNA-binding protein
VRAVEEYIDQNFKSEIRLKTLSDIAGMTPAAFSRFFRTRTGKTVSDYIIDTRLGYASRLLVDSHTNVAEICYSCGFNNISNFNRIFKKKKGCSPTAFRDNYHKSKIII